MKLGARMGTYMNPHAATKMLRRTKLDAMLHCTITEFIFSNPRGTDHEQAEQRCFHITLPKTLARFYYWVLLWLYFRLRNIFMAVDLLPYL